MATNCEVGILAHSWGCFGIGSSVALSSCFFRPQEQHSQWVWKWAGHEEWFALHCLATAWHFFLVSFSLRHCHWCHWFYLPLHPVPLGVAQWLSIIFCLESRQRSSAITQGTLFFPSYRVNARGILKRNKVRESSSRCIFYFLCCFLLWDISWTIIQVTLTQHSGWGTDLKGCWKSTYNNHSGPSAYADPNSRVTLEQHGCELLRSIST